MTTQQTLRKRVRNGAELLDSIDATWATKIDLANFDVEYPSQCVLGQVFGGYNLGLNALEPHCVTTNEQIQYGFEEDFDHSKADEFDQLTKLWAAEIKARR